MKHESSFTCLFLCFCTSVSVNKVIGCSNLKPAFVLVAGDSDAQEQRQTRYWLRSRGEAPPEIPLVDDHDRQQHASVDFNRSRSRPPKAQYNKATRCMPPGSARAYPCPCCDRKFVKRANLMQHILTVHHNGGTTNQLFLSVLVY